MQATTARFPAENVDNIFTSVATSTQTLARKVDNKSGVSTFGLLDFILAIVHVAHQRFSAENPSQVSVTSQPAPKRPDLVANHTNSCPASHIVWDLLLSRVPIKYPKHFLGNAIPAHCQAPTNQIPITPPYSPFLSTLNLMK